MNAIKDMNEIFKDEVLSLNLTENKKIKNIYELCNTNNLGVSLLSQKIVADILKFFIHDIDTLILFEEILSKEVNNTLEKLLESQSKGDAVNNSLIRAADELAYEKLLFKLSKVISLFFLQQSFDQDISGVEEAYKQYKTNFVSSDICEVAICVLKNIDDNTFNTLVNDIETRINSLDAKNKNFDNVMEIINKLTETYNSQIKITEIAKEQLNQINIELFSVIKNKISNNESIIIIPVKLKLSSPMSMYDFVSVFQMNKSFKNLYDHIGNTFNLAIKKLEEVEIPSSGEIVKIESDKFKVIKTKVDQFINFYKQNITY